MTHIKLVKDCTIAIGTGHRQNTPTSLRSRRDIPGDEKKTHSRLVKRDDLAKCLTGSKIVHRLIYVLQMNVGGNKAINVELAFAPQLLVDRDIFGRNG